MNEAVRRSVRAGLFLASAMAFAAGNGGVTGVVKDPSGAVVPSARVILRGAGGFEKSAETDARGRYRLETVPAGRYEITASATGFETEVRRDVAVREARETTVAINLRIGLQATNILVSAGELQGAASVEATRARVSDAAALLDGRPGLSLYGSGGLSGLPAIHGMADDRVKVVVNGMTLASACGNHMNPATSYIAPASVGNVTVLAGIAPVSRGGDSIGGTVLVEASAPEFAAPGDGFAVHGGVSGYHRSNGVVNGGYAWLSAAGEHFRIGYNGSYVNANNYKDGAGRAVKSTFYEAQNHAAQIAMRRGAHQFGIDAAYQYIPQQGFANARMDMTGNESRSAALHYRGSFARLRLDGRVFVENTRHGMNILRDKIPGMNMPMYTHGRNLGYTAALEIPLGPRDVLRVGNELHRFRLDDWWPPVMAMVGSMGPGTHLNVADGRRTRFGTYLEWEGRRGRDFTALLGVRSDVVRMNSGDVVGYNTSPTAAGSGAYYADAREFNASDRKRLDSNFDVTALGRWEPDRRSTYELGYARKTRSPGIYERYLWVKRSFMSVTMNGWFGDGNGYTGNLALRPEVAHTVSGTASWHGVAKNSWEVRVTPYFTRVVDFIDVDRCPPIADNSNGCTAALYGAATGFVTLRFQNHAARLIGADASARVPLGGAGRSGSLWLNGVFGYVRGENLDTGGYLYQIMPVHGGASLEHRRGGWSSAFELSAVDAKRNVQKMRNELRTAGYALLNLRTAYEWTVADRAGVRVDAGIDNLANRRYDQPLGGRYWVGDKTGNSPVAGMGRSVFAGMTFRF